MKDFKNIYKPVPERFHYMVTDAVKEATVESRKSCVSHKWLRIIVVALVIVALTTTTVYGSSGLYKLIVNNRGNFALGLSAEVQKNSPLYVKFIADFEEYEKMIGTSGLKFCKDGNNIAEYSFSLSRPKRGFEELFENVKDYRTLYINNKEAVLITGSGTMEMTRVSMYFEEVNILLTCYVNSEIAEEEIIKNLEKVQVVEGSVSDNTPYIKPVKSLNDEVFYSANQYTVNITGENFTVYPEIETSVKNIKIYDTAKGLDTDDFYFWGNSVDEYIANDGSLYPRVSDIWNFGDGINETDTFVKSEKKEQKIVLAELNYVNKSDNKYSFSIDWRLEYLEEYNSSNLKLAQIYDSDRNIGDGLAQYIKNANPGKSYYVYTLEPGETKTFTVGYLCDDELLSDAYLVCTMDSSNSNDVSAVKVQSNE